MVGSGYLSAFSCGWMAAISAPAPPTGADRRRDLQVFDGMVGERRDDRRQSRGELELTTLLMMMRFMLPTTVCGLGPRRRAPRRRKNGARTLRMAMPVKVMSSTMAPSTDSSAKPWQLSKTQLEMVMFLKPPLVSVPSLMRPVPHGPFGRFDWLPRAVEHRAKFEIASDVAVGDG